MKHKISLILSGLILIGTTNVAIADKGDGRLLKNNKGQPILLKQGGNSNAKGSGSKFNNKNNNKVIVNQGKKQNNKVIVNQGKKQNNKVIVAPGKKQPNKTVIVTPAKKKPNKTIIVAPPKKHKNTVVIQPVRQRWIQPIIPGWAHWHGGKVVLVNNHHSHYNAFAFVMTAMTMAIVIDQATDKPYTDTGKEVIVKERSCTTDADPEVIELDDELLVITCKK